MGDRLYLLDKLLQHQAIVCPLAIAMANQPSLDKSWLSDETRLIMDRPMNDPRVAVKVYMTAHRSFIEQTQTILHGQLVMSARTRLLMLTSLDRMCLLTASTRGYCLVVTCRRPLVVYWPFMSEMTSHGRMAVPLFFLLINGPIQQ